MSSKGEPKGHQAASTTILEAVLEAPAAPAPPPPPEPAPPPDPAEPVVGAASFPTHLDTGTNFSPEATPEEKLAALNHLVLNGADIDEKLFKELYGQLFGPLGATEADATKQWQALQARLAEQRARDQQLAEQMRQQAGATGATRPWDPLADGPGAAAESRRMSAFYQAAIKDRAPGGAPQLKDAIVKELSQRSGLGYLRVNAFVKSWAGSSSDNQTESIALQAAAAEKFGLEPTPFIKKQDEWKANSADYAKTREQARRCLDAMYARTQQWFAERGIKELTLFRGMKKTVGADPTPLKTTGQPLEVTAHLNPLNSWSTSYDIAHAFSGVDGYVLSARVPVSRVVGCCFTGVGCLNEKEFVVLGGTGQKVTGAWNGKVHYGKVLSGGK